MIILGCFVMISYQLFIIFWYQPINIVPSASCCFLPGFCFTENQYQTKSKCHKLFGDFLLDKINIRSFERRPEDLGGPHEPPGRAWGGRRALVPRGPHQAPFDLIPAL